MQEVISRDKWKVLAGDRDFDDPGIKIQRELYRLTPPEMLKGKYVVDIGAYIGDSVKYYLDCGAQVTAFEAFPDAYQCLCHNCPESENRLEVIGSRGQHVELVDSPMIGTNYGTRRVDVVSVAGLDVLAIDSWNRTRKVDIFKVDVEGFEWAVMEGARLTLRVDRPIIIVEVFDSALARYERGRADVLRWLPERYNVRVGVGRYEDDRCDLLCEPINAASRSESSATPVYAEGEGKTSS